MYDPEKLRKFRQKANLTQEQLHRLTVQAFPPDGVSLAAIQKIENGDRTGKTSMPKLAQCLGVSLESLKPKDAKNGTKRKTA